MASDLDRKINEYIKNGDLENSLLCAKEKLIDRSGSKNQLTQAYITRRNSLYNKKTVKTAEGLENAINEGWETVKKNKKSWSIQKKKNHDIGFEELCWSIFARMGFNFLNLIIPKESEEKFKIPFKRDDNSIDSKQIDVIAANNEVVIIAECKSKEKRSTTVTDHKSIVKAWNNDLDSIRASLTKIFGRSRKVVFIWITNNIRYSSPTIEELESKSWHYFTQDTIDYFSALANDLKEAAGYQLIGRLFRGKKIPELKTKFPGIRDKIGGNECYIFSCPPEILLKIGYVVHQRDRSEDADAFQRLVRPTRLKQIRNFIDNGGYFPNSIILNIKGKRKKYSGWHESELQDHDGNSRLGIIELPQVYRSAFIIDGQHRLYGFTDNNDSLVHAVPVVMFYNLSSSEQTRVFEQINATQKAPPAGLIKAITSDLDWDSENEYDMVQALKTKIFIKLNNDQKSPFYDRVVIGEDSGDNFKCLNLKTILDQGMGSKTKYFGSFKNGKLIEPGFLWRGNRDATFKESIVFISNVFSYIEIEYPEQWNLGKSPGGLLTMNIGIVCFLKLFELVLDYEVRFNSLKPRLLSGENLSKLMLPYLDDIISYIKTVPETKIKEWRDSSRGSGGYKKILGAFCYAINKNNQQFEPDILEEFIDAESGKYNETANRIVDGVEKRLSDVIEKRLTKKYGEDWWERGVKASIKKTCYQRKVDEDEEMEKQGLTLLQKPPRAYLQPVDYAEIISDNKLLFSTEESIERNNPDIFYFCPPDVEGRQGMKEKLKWLRVNFNIARRQAKHIGTKGPVTKDSCLDLEDIDSWFGDKMDAFIKNII